MSAFQLKQLVISDSGRCQDEAVAVGVSKIVVRPSVRYSIVIEDAVKKLRRSSGQSDGVMRSAA